MEHLDAVDEVVDLLHEVVKEDRLAETHAQVLDLGNKDSHRFMSIILVITLGFKSCLICKGLKICKLKTFVGKALSSEKSASCAPCEKSRSK